MGDSPKVDLRKHKPEPWQWAAAWMFVGGILVLVLGFLYINQVDAKRQQSEDEARADVVAAEREADRRWCKLLVPLDNSYQSSAAVQSTELGRRVAKAIHDIRAEIGCEG